LPDLNPLDYHCVGAIRGRYTLKLTNIAELKTALLSIWNDLPQEFTEKATLWFRKRLYSILCCCSWRTLWIEHSV